MQQYECKQCKTKFEKADSCGCSCSQEDLKCPQCAGTDLEKVDNLGKISDFFENLNFSAG